MEWGIWDTIIISGIGVAYVCIAVLVGRFITYVFSHFVEESKSFTAVEYGLITIVSVLWLFCLAALLLHFLFSVIANRLEKALRNQSPEKSQ